MLQVDVTKARQEFAETLDKVRHARERVIIRKHGRDAAALVPMEDLRLLELMEDREDLAAARRTLAQGGPSIPWEKYKRSRREREARARIKAAASAAKGRGTASTRSGKTPKRGRAA